MNEARRQRYARAKPFALAALELESALREGYVESVCAGDQNLRDEVGWMLQAADNTCDSPLQLLLAGDLRDQAGSLVAGAGNSRYRIVRQLGEGGMGVVYQAERLLNEGTTDEIRQQVALKFINTGRLLRPSRRHRRDRAAPGAVRRVVPADIDAIVMKALRRDLTDRYANVAEFSADLEHFLDLRPVRARRGHHWYHVALFVRRHRRGLGMAALLALVLAGFVVERESQLRKVELERDKTRAIAGFLQDLFENADPTHAGGSQVTVRQMLDRGAAQLMQRRDIAAPVRVSLLLSMARSCNQLSLGESAVTLLKEAGRLQGTCHATLLERGEVKAALGRGYSTLMNPPSAIVADDQAIALRSQASGNHMQAILRVGINQLYNHLGVLDIPLDDIDHQLRSLFAQLEAAPGQDPELRVQALAVLAMTEVAEGQDQAAIATAARAVEDAHKLCVRDDPTQLYYRFMLALVSLRLHPADALQGFRQAIADYDKSIGTPSPSLAALLGYFGGALAQMGRTNDAVSALERSARIAAHCADASPEFYLDTLSALAQQYLELGRDADAASLLLPHLDELRKRAASRSVWATTNLAEALDTLGTVALHHSQLAQAEQYFRQARDGLDLRAQQVSAQSYAASLVGLGEAVLARGQASQASVWLAAVQGSNAHSRAALRSARALDAAGLQARLAIAQGNFRQAMGLAVTAEAIASHRWGRLQPTGAGAAGTGIGCTQSHFTDRAGAGDRVSGQRRRGCKLNGGSTT